MNPTAREAIATVQVKDWLCVGPDNAEKILAALRVAAGAPEGAPIVIDADDRLGWLEQPVAKIRREEAAYVPAPVCVINESDAAYVAAIFRQEFDNVEPLFRVVGIDPEAGS